MPRPLLPVLVLLAVLLLALTPPPGTASAARPAEEALVRVLLDDVAPVLPRPRAAVVLRGGVLEGEDVTALRIAVGRRAGSRAELAGADARPGYARRLPPVPFDAPLDGGTRPFALVTSPDELGLGEPGVYAVGVEALVGDVVLARTDTFLPWFPDGAPGPVGLGVLLPLHAPPLLAPGGRLSDEAAAVALRLLAPEGRLGRLVAAAAADGAAEPAPVTWAVDADTLRTAEEAAGRAGPGAEVAVAWLAALREAVQAQATAGRPPVALPYADADLPALLSEGDLPLAVDAVRTGATEAARLLGAPTAPDVAWPADGALPAAGVAALQRAGTAALVLDGTDVVERAGAEGAGDLEDLPVDVLVPDASLSSLTTPSSSDLRGGPAVPRQRLLVETALLAVERADDPRPAVLATPRTWDPSPDWARTVLRLADTAPWLAPAAPLEAAVPAAEAAEAAADALEVTGGSADLVRADPLDGAWTDDVEALAARLDRLGSLVVPDDQAVLAPQRRSVLRAVSAAWRSPTEVERGRRLLRATAEHLDALLGGVRLTGADVVTLTSDAGDLPVTVTNDLPARVQLAVQVDAGGAGRLTPEAAPRLVLAPGSSQTVPVPVQAGTSGRFAVEIRLTTVDGRPVGATQEVLVRVTALGRLALAITVGSVAVLLLASGVRLLRRGLRARDAAAQRDASAQREASAPAGAP